MSREINVLNKIKRFKKVSKFFSINGVQLVYVKIEIVGNNKYFGIYYDIFEEYCEIIKKYIC